MVITILLPSRSVAIMTLSASFPWSSISLLNIRDPGIPDRVRIIAQACKIVYGDELRFAAESNDFNIIVIRIVLCLCNACKSAALTVLGISSGGGSSSSRLQHSGSACHHTRLLRHT